MLEAGVNITDAQEITDIFNSIHIGDGLPGVKSQELLRFPNDRLGMAFNLDPDTVGVVLLDSSGGIEAGEKVRRTGRVLDVPVGEDLLGRVIDATGRPLDGRGSVPAGHPGSRRRP